MSMCRVFSCVVGRGCLLWSVHSLGKTLLALALLHFVLQGQTCLLLQVSPDFIPLHSISLWWKEYLKLITVLEGLAGLHRTVPLQLLQCYWWGIDLDYCDTEWFALETNRDHCVIFEIELKYCILDSFVDYEDYSISSKAFVPTGVDLMESELNSPIPVHLIRWFLECQCSFLPSPVWPLPICLDSWT